MSGAYLDHVFVSLFILGFSALCGGIGGLTSYVVFNSESSLKTTPIPSHNSRPSNVLFGGLKSYVLVGMTAGLVVPMVISAINPDLFGNIIEPPSRDKFFSNTARLTGFAVLSGVFSRYFLQTAAEQALKIAQGANAKSTENEKTISVLEDAVENSDRDNREATSDSLPRNDGPPENDNFVTDIISKLSDLDQKIIISLAEFDDVENPFNKNNYDRRTLAAISISIDEHKPQIGLKIDRLEELELLQRRRSGKTGNILYSLTQKGCQVATELRRDGQWVKLI